MISNRSYEYSPYVQHIILDSKQYSEFSEFWYSKYWYSKNYTFSR